MPGKQNSEHYHPCDESLYLLAGELKHTIDTEATTLIADDLIHIPDGDCHQAMNMGTEDAIAVIVYDTGTRKVSFVDTDSE